jgi:hypothetical protein
VHNAQYWGELEYILSKYSNFPTNFGGKNQPLLEVGFFAQIKVFNEKYSLKFAPLLCIKFQ